VTLSSLFWPSSVAIIGASDDPESLSGRPLEILLQHGYRGALYPVNPRHQEIRGLPCYPTIGDIGEPVDVALVAVRASQVIGLLRECAKSAVRHVVVISSGFAEEGSTGEQIEAQIKEIADSSGMRVCGPNGEGFLNVRGGVPLTFSPTADYERGLSNLISGPLAVVSQSGGLGFAMFNWGLDRGVGFSYVVSTGNEADLECLEVVDFLLDDDDTQVIMMLVEGLRHPERLGPVARKASALGKFIVVSKLGRTKSGSRAAASHTAHLAGSDAAYRAAFDRYGIVLAEDQDELLDVAIALGAGRTMKGPRVAVVTLSGGAGVWVADVCEAEGLEVPELAPEVQQALRRHMPSYGSPRNPVDVTAQVWRTGDLAAALETLLAADAVDGIVLVLSLASSLSVDRQRSVLSTLVSTSPLPIVVYSYTKPSVESLTMLNDMRLPCYTSPRRAARVMRALAQVGPRRPSEDDWTPDSRIPMMSPPPRRLSESRGGAWYEHPAKELLRAWEIAVPQGELVRSAPDAGRAADAIGYPVALKIQSPDLPHKSDIGGLVLGLTTRAAVEASYDELVRRVSHAAPGAHIAGVLVEATAGPGQAMIVGAINDSDFGPIVMVGTGGVHAEVLNDTAFALAPLSQVTASDLVSQVRGSVLLDGMRGEPPADRRALEELLVTVSRLMVAYQATIRELDLNPVIVHPRGRGLSVVDAWITGQ
jgi:acyl-CoA synthetase (NDP forming)